MVIPSFDDFLKQETKRKPDIPSFQSFMENQAVSNINQTRPAGSQPLQSSDLLPINMKDTAIQTLPERPKPVAQQTPEPVREDPSQRNAVTRTLNRVFQDNPVARVINRPFAAAAEAITPDRPMIGRREDGSFGSIPGTSVREEQQRINPLPDTGSEFANKALDVTGQIGSYFINPGAPAQGPVALYNAARNIGATRGSQAITNRISSPVGQRMAQEAIQEGATAAAYAVPHSLIRGEETAPEIARNVALEGALGAAGGAVVGGVGHAIRKGMESQQLNNSIRDFIGRTQQQNLGITPFPERIGPYDNLRTDTKSQIVTKTKKESTSANQKANQMYINLVDDLKRQRDFDRYTEDVLGVKLAPDEKTYNLALSSRGSDIIANQILTNNMVDMTGNEIGRSLKDRISSLPRGSYVDFEDYLINKHAMTRFDRGEKVFRDDLNWTPEVGAQRIAEYEAKYPQFREVSEDYYDFSRNMVKNWLVDSGLLPENVAQQWFEENPFYVPMQRHFSELEKAGTAQARKGFANQKAPVKGYSKTGSERSIYSPLESTIENVDKFVKSAKRNQVMQALVQNIRRHPEEFKEWAEIVPVREDATGNSLKDINTLLRENGVEGLADALEDNFSLAFRRSPNQGLNKDNIVTGMVNGQPVHVKINDKQLLESLEALGPEGQNVVLDTLGNVTRVFKVLTTGANPVFGLTRNLTRDIVQAFIGRKNAKRADQFGRDLVESFVSSLGNGRLYNSYKNVGGGHSSPVAADRNLLAQSKREILPQSGLRSTVPRAFSSIENFMNALESTPRLGEYKRADNTLQGMLDAQDITVNFKKRGRIGKQIDKVFPYFNAAMQGLDKLARMYRDDPIKALGRTVSSITVPTIALYALNYNDPNYQKVSKHQRDNFFLIPKGDGTYWRIAKHRELGVPFSAAVERALDQWLKDDPTAFRNFADTVRVAFMPPGLSGAMQEGGIPQRLSGMAEDTILGPIFEVGSNRNFAGAPIVNAGLERLSPELQYDEKTSEISKWVGRVTKRISDKTGVNITTSPKQLDHLIRSYTGVLGQLGLPATTTSGGNFFERMTETLMRQVNVDPVYSNQIADEFYSYKEKLDRAYDDAKVTGEVPAWYDDNLRKSLNRLNSDLSDGRKYIREIESRDDLTSKQKREMSREVRIIMNNMTDEVNTVLRERLK